MQGNEDVGEEGQNDGDDEDETEDEAGSVGFVVEDNDVIDVMNVKRCSDGQSFLNSPGEVPLPVVFDCCSRRLKMWRKNKRSQKRKKVLKIKTKAGAKLKTATTRKVDKQGSEKSCWGVQSDLRAVECRNGINF